MRYTVVFMPRAEKDLAKLPARDAKRVVSRIERLADNPRPENAKKLVGTDDLYRLRVSAYRVIYQVVDERVVVVVVRIRDRKDAYKDDLSKLAKRAIDFLLKLESSASTLQSSDITAVRIPDGSPASVHAKTTARPV